MKAASISTRNRRRRKRLPRRFWRRASRLAQNRLHYDSLQNQKGSAGDDEREQDCRRHNIPLACGAQIISAPGEVSRKGYERHANPGHSHRKKRNNQNDPLAKSSDLEMLFMPGGRERTCPEWDTLFAEAGFEITRIFPMKTAKA